MSNALALNQLASRLSMTEQDLEAVILQTVMPVGKQVSTAQFATFVAVANEYKLNPLTKEIYAFPTQGGGIQPIVSIDGWLKIINTHPDFNGMTFTDDRDDSGNLISITCNIYKKGIEHPVQVTEYMAECKMNTQPWTKYPARMLRHKSAIQGGRYAFGISGIIDPDEADRYKDAGVIDVDQGTAGDNELSFYPDADFEHNFPTWSAAIEAGRKTPDAVIDHLASKGIILSDAQKEKLNQVTGEANENA